MAEKDIYTVGNMKKKWKYQTAIDGTIELVEYKGEDEDIEIPPRIGKNRVSRLRTPEELDGFFPNGIDRVTFSDGLTYIDNEVFSTTVEVQSIPESVMVIGDSAFLAVPKKLDILEKNYECIDRYYYRKKGKKKRMA